MSVKGNINAIFNNGGRPSQYKDPKELEERIIEYFDLFTEKEDQEKTIYGYKPTTTGLALFLGFESRQSLYDYKDKPEFSYIIKKALTLIEMGYEYLLESKAYGGAIFALKNMGWKDKVEQEHSFPSGNVTIQSEGKRPETD